MLAKMSSLETILSGYTCQNRPFKADELQEHVARTHSKSWCGIGVKIFLHDLYPSPLTEDKQFTSKEGQKKKTKGKNSHSQLLSHVIILLTHTLKQNYIAGPSHSQTSTPFSLILKNKYIYSHGILNANSVTEPSRMVND